ncbi:hypothetical protein Taro_029275 [Colocasia esculenta]|uniref:Aminotransferase-like plant mobile domain-containing protein n=1 Tax=Colocasia esculenta TaxID=4460 RepID=A0A843VIK6_COLES|nr:hypothetical protein [Colocasia esculenta]
MESSSMRSKVLLEKRTDDDDSAPSTSSSSDDGAKCQSTQRKASGAQRKKNEFKNALKGICSLENYVKERDQLGFRDCHRAILRTTPFAPFVDSNHRAIFKMTLIGEIAHTYKGASNFQIGDKTLTFTVEDVALILGLPCCGQRVPHYYSPIKLSKLHHRFGAKLTFDRKVVTKLIRQLVQSDDACDVDDTARLWIVLLLSTFLCPRSSPCCPPQMLICLDNIDEIGRYNWAAAVTEMTLHKFDHFVTIVREKRSGRTTTPKRRIGGREHGSANIFGCSAALAIIKRLKVGTKEKTIITCVSQEKMHLQTEGVAAPPHPEIMALLQGLGDEIKLLPERLQQAKSSNEAQIEAFTTAITMGFNKMEKLIRSSSMPQDQPIVGTDAEKFISTPQSITPAPALASPKYGDANAFALIVDQEIIALDPVSAVSTTVLLSPTSLVKNIKCRDDRQPGIYDQSPFKRLDKAPKKKKGKKAMSKLMRFYKQWTWKSEANESQTALVEAFLAQEGYVDHKHTVLTFTNNYSLKWSHIWDILWGNMTDDEEPILKAYLGYEGYTNADEFQLIFDELCPQQPSSSMNCAMYIFIGVIVAEIGLQEN